jgi:hypothetical protein
VASPSDYNREVRVLKALVFEDNGHYHSVGSFDGRFNKTGFQKRFPEKAVWTNGVNDGLYRSVHVLLPRKRQNAGFSAIQPTLGEFSDSASQQRARTWLIRCPSMLTTSN